MRRKNSAGARLAMLKLPSDREVSGIRAGARVAHGECFARDGLDPKTRQRLPGLFVDQHALDGPEPGQDDFDVGGRLALGEHQRRGVQAEAGCRGRHGKRRETTATRTSKRPSFFVGAGVGANALGSRDRAARRCGDRRGRDGDARPRNRRPALLIHHHAVDKKGWFRGSGCGSPGTCAANNLAVRPSVRRTKGWGIVIERSTGKCRRSSRLAVWIPWLSRFKLFGARRPGRVPGNTKAMLSATKLNTARLIGFYIGVDGVPALL